MKPRVSARRVGHRLMVAELPLIGEPQVEVVVGRSRRVGGIRPGRATLFAKAIACSGGDMRGERAAIAGSGLSEAEWEALVREAEQSGLKGKGFCEARGLAVSWFDSCRYR